MMKIHALNLMLPQMAIKILHTIRQGKIGGGETHVLDLVTHLDDRFTSEVLAFTHGEMVDRLSQMGVTCHVIETERPFDVRVWGKTRRLMQERGIQVVHAHGTRACSNSFWGAQKLTCPCYIPSMDGPSTRIKRLPSATCAYAESAFGPSNRSKYFGFSIKQPRRYPSSRHAQQPSGDLRSEHRPFQSGSGGCIEKGRSWHSQRQTCGRFSGASDQTKRSSNLVRAAAEVLKSHGDVHFALVGGGELEADCRSLATALGVTEKLHFIGFRTDVPDVLKPSMCTAFPPCGKGCPSVFLKPWP